ncbi:MAG: hypothetical protein HUU15_16935 [Candidatus Brocadiae bacterium]|nr:hypothetical protein [Candidatus Brocadiia bacterium]
MRVLITVLTLALPACAGGLFDLDGKSIDEYGAVLRLRGWSSEMDAGVQDSTDLQPGSIIEFDEDTPLDRRLYIPEVDLELRFAELAFHLTTWRASDSTRGSFREDEGFDGHAFATGDRALHRFRVWQAAAHFEWIPFDLGSHKTIGLEIGAIIGARLTRMEAFFRDSASGKHYRSTSTAALPDLGVTVSLGFLNCVEIEGWASGMYAPFSNWDYVSINGGIEIRLHLDQHFYFGGGYRFSSGSIERGDADDDGRLLEYLYHGPSVTFGLRF